ncbi:hypothetical protein [Gluconobacter sphaericus]|nr:hypothetical protein [Gluconobacter sphaericus]
MRYRTGTKLVLGILCTGFGLCLFLNATALAVLRTTATLRETSAP